LRSAESLLRRMKGTVFNLFLCLSCRFYFVSGLPTLLGSGLVGDGGGGVTVDDLGSVALDVSDKARTRLHGTALRLDVELLEFSATSGSVFRASPTHLELETKDNKWSATASGNKLSLYLNDKVVAQVTEDKIVSRDVLLDKKQGGQMRVNLCSARAAMRGEDVGACERQRDASHLTVTEAFEALSEVIFDAVKSHLSSSSSSSSATAAAAPQAGRSDDDKVRDILKTLFAAELQPQISRDVTSRLDAAKAEMRGNDQDRRQIAELEGLVTGQRSTLEALRREVAALREAGAGAGAGAGGGGETAELSALRAELTAATTSWKKEKDALTYLVASTNVTCSRRVEAEVSALKASLAAGELSVVSGDRDGRERDRDALAQAQELAAKNAVALAVVQSQVDKALEERRALDETVVQLRERVSKLEALIEFAMKK